MVHWLRIEGVVQELYDVVALPGATRPAAIGFKAKMVGHGSPLLQGHDLRRGSRHKKGPGDWGGNRRARGASAVGRPTL